MAKARSIGELLSPFPWQRTIEVKTRSGRKFRFDVTEYWVFADTTPGQVKHLAERIVAEKYRFCKWDRGHPRVNAQAEILEAVRRCFLKLIKWMKQAQVSRQSEKK